ncbi:unnamed protein product [Penicillium olsonii]|nr:unnamed protein product [Penicillium olsonii]
MRTRPSAMVRKFMQANASTDPPRPTLLPAGDDSAANSWPQDPIRDEYCFFYGTLMDPDTLCKVLGLSRPPPLMRPARIIGYQIKLWGPYPALLDDKPLHQLMEWYAGSYRRRNSIDWVPTNRININFKVA